jgi:hypothetical protein
MINREAAKFYYNENVVGEPLTEQTPIDAHIAGQTLILCENKKNYKKALKKLEYMQKQLFDMHLQNEWFNIVNAMRICAGINEMELNK